VTESEFLKIKDAKEALKGSFKGVIIKQGDLKAGTKNDKDWTKRVFTIGDDTAEADLVAWGDEISKFKVGYTYEIVNPWWKTYEGKVTVQVGNYGTAKVIGSENTIPETPPPPPAETLKEKPKTGDTMVNEKDTQTVPSQHISAQSKLTEQKPDESKIVTLTDIELQTVEEATTKLLAISLAVGEKLEEVTENPSREFVMEATKIIYQNYFLSNFKKASEIK